MTRHVEPLDPNSPKGKEVADRLSQAMAEVMLAVAERRRAAQRAADTRTDPDTSAA